MTKEIVESQFVPVFGMKRYSIEPGTGTNYQILACRFKDTDLDSVGQLGTVQGDGFLVVDCVTGHAGLVPDHSVDVHWVEEAFRIKNIPDLYFLCWLIRQTLSIRVVGLNSLALLYKKEMGRALPGSFHAVD